MRRALSACIFASATLAVTTLTLPLSSQAAPNAILAKPAQTALLRALEDEYHAEAFYAAIIDKFGQVRPFTNIIKAERVHSSMLATMMKNYGMEVPANTQLGSADIKAAVPATLAAACQAGVSAEIVNRDLYEQELMPAVAGQKDIETVFKKLSAASNDRHLPAFERCARR